MNIEPGRHLRHLHRAVGVLLIGSSSAACSLFGWRAAATATPTVVSPPATETATPTTPPTLTPTVIPIPPTRAPTATELVFIATNRIEQSKTPKYTISFDLPYLSSGGAAAELFNDAVEQLARSEEEQFLAEITTNEAWRQANMPEFGSDLIINHRVRFNHDGLVSVQFTISVYIAGAAHPNTYTLVINLDSRNPPAFLSLSQLFVQQSDYLDLLSTYCADNLRARDALQFPDGAAPNPENFANWLFDSQGLVIIFDPYQVAPYALGMQEVLVPYLYLEPVTDPLGALGKVIE